MKTSPVSFPMLAGGFCGFAAAAAIGWGLAGDSPALAPSVSEPPAASRKSDRPSRPPRLSSAAAAAGNRLAAVRGAANPEARMRATIDLANSLPVSEFGAWMEGGYFNLRGGAELTLFSKILMERWMKEDPEGLVVWSMKNETYQSQQILSEWSNKEPQRAIAFFKNHPNEVQEIRMLQDIANEHPDLALRRFQELATTGISNKTSSYASGLIWTLAEKSPAALAAALASMPPALQFQAEAALSGQRLKASFSKEIRALWELPTGWKIFERNAQQNRKMATAVFDELANLPPAWRSSLVSNSYYFIDMATAQKWLDADLTAYGFTPEQEKSLKKNALNQMDRSKPEDVFRRMEEMELGEDERRNVIQNAIGYQSHDAEKAEALIALLSNETDQEIARSILKGRSGNEDQSKPDKPDDWLERMSGLDPKNGRAYSLMSSIQNWDMEKMSELKSQFNKMPDEKRQIVAQVIVNNANSASSGSELQGEAIRYLVANPVETSENQRNTGRDIISTSSSYVVNLALNDPYAATEWIHTLPAGDAKSWAEKNLASNWAQYDPKAVEQWLKTLPPASREDVKKFMNKK